MTWPSEVYRWHLLRYACRAFASREDEAVLLGVPINNLPMDDLEAFFELVMGFHPRRLAPPEYRTARSG